MLSGLLTLNAQSILPHADALPLSLLACANILTALEEVLIVAPNSVMAHTCTNNYKVQSTVKNSILLHHLTVQVSQKIS